MGIGPSNCVSLVISGLCRLTYTYACWRSHVTSVPAWNLERGLRHTRLVVVSRPTSHQNAGLLMFRTRHVNFVHAYVLRSLLRSYSEVPTCHRKSEYPSSLILRDRCTHSSCCCLPRWLLLLDEPNHTTSLHRESTPFLACVHRFPFRLL
jgi:hypothetical protein